jgi:hypothetical protein
MPGPKRIVFDFGGILVDKAPGRGFAAAEFRSEASPGFFHVVASRLRGAPIFSQANHGLGGGTPSLVGVVA